MTDDPRNAFHHGAQQAPRTLTGATPVLRTRWSDWLVGKGGVIVSQADWPRCDLLDGKTNKIESLSNISVLRGYCLPGGGGYCLHQEGT